MLYAFIKACFSTLSHSIFEENYYTKIFLNDNNYQLQSPLQKTGGELQTSTAPPVWTMPVFERCGVTCIPEMVWSWTLPTPVISLPLESKQLWATLPLAQLCVHWHHSPTSAGTAVPQQLSYLWQGQQPDCAPAKLKNCFYWGCWNPTFIRDTFMNSSVLPVDAPAQTTTIEMSNSCIP